MVSVFVKDTYYTTGVIHIRKNLRDGFVAMRTKINTARLRYASSLNATQVQEDIKSNRMPPEKEP
jgi:hypothetical protein